MNRKITSFTPSNHAKMLSKHDKANDMKNYKIIKETKTTPFGVILHRIVATTTFTLSIGITINAGDTGGWIEKESNLSDNA